MNSPASATLVLAVGIEGDLEHLRRDRSLRVEPVETADACLSSLEEGGVGAIVSGLDLPDGNGLDLLDRVRTLDADLPFFLFTDAGNERIAGRAIASDVDGYVPASHGGEILHRRILDEISHHRASGATETPWRITETSGRTDPASNSRSSEPFFDGDPSSEDENARYRYLVETSPVPINVFDADGTIVYGNEAVYDLLGIDDGDDLVGRSIFDFIRTEDRSTAWEELATVIEEKRSVGPTQMVLERPDGEWRHVQVATAPGRYEGRDVGQAVIVDVTPLLSTEQALRAERRFIDDALDALPDVFFFVSSDGEFERWNETAIEVTGFPASELAEMDVHDLFEGDDLERVLESISVAIETGQSTVEASLLTADNRTIPFEFRGQRLLDDDGNLRGVVGIGRDVTGRNARTRQLRTIDRVLRHNLRNALTTIGGRAEMIRDAASGSMAEDAAAIFRTSERLARSAEKERTIVRLLIDRPEPKPIDLLEILEGAIDDVASRYPDATITVGSSPRATALAVEPVPDALVELLENAIVHNRSASPTATVFLEVEDRTVNLRVLDGGPPIPEQEREALDDPTGEQSQLEHGKGVGLWLVSLVARYSRGTVRIERTDGENVVTLTLPRPRVERPPGASAQEPNR